MEYYKSRIILLNSPNSQQLGDFIEDDESSTFGGDVTYTIHHSNVFNRKLQIIKYKKGTAQTIDGVKLKIYAKLDSGASGWLTTDEYSEDNLKNTLSKDFTKGKKFETSDRWKSFIKKLN